MRRLWRSTAYCGGETCNVFGCFASELLSQLAVTVNVVISSNVHIGRRHFIPERHRLGLAECRILDVRKAFEG